MELGIPRGGSQIGPRPGICEDCTCKTLGLGFTKHRVKTRPRLRPPQPYAPKEDFFSSLKGGFGKPGLRPETTVRDRALPGCSLPVHVFRSTGSGPLCQKKITAARTRHVRRRTDLVAASIRGRTHNVQGRAGRSCRRGGVKRRGDNRRARRASKHPGNGALSRVQAMPLHATSARLGQPPAGRAAAFARLAKERLFC